MKESRQALKFGVGAGLIGVLCCLGPVLAILIGFGGATALFGLDRYKPAFIGLGLIVLIGASWYAVRKRNRCCTTRNRLKDLQVVALIFGVGILTYGGMFYGVVPVLSHIAGEKIEARQAANAPTSFKASSINLRVDGMTCAGCAVGVKQALLEVPGVIAAEVDWETGLAKVEYDRNQVGPEEILKAKVQEEYTLSLQAPQEENHTRN